jgi:adenylosuccinate lyase
MFVLNEEDKMITQLACVSPIDGRYYNKTKELRPYFSEYAFFQHRLNIEIAYLHKLLTFLMENDKLESCNISKIKTVATDFSLTECIKIKNYEKTINHDVKAIEYYIRDKLEELNLGKFSSFIHFGLTSQDINNTALPIMIKNFINQPYLTRIQNILKNLFSKTTAWKNDVIISKTHGQPATPTTFGKEMRVFHYRLTKQIDQLNSIKYYGKLGGATGNLNAHLCAYPDVNWKVFMRTFLSQFDLLHNEYTTQIDNYENLSCIFDLLKRINTILIDLCQDIWLYISYEYLSLSINTNEVGSSTMPHKVNPINFENAEGNLLMANAIFEFLSRKLPVSRLQRDLTDSTLIRNIGVAFGHTFIALSNIYTGLNKIDVNRCVINNDIAKYQIVLIEGVQTILRKHGYTDAYEQCKDFSRNNSGLNILDLEAFVSNLKVEENVRDEILNMLDVKKYIGNANKCCE